MRFLLILAAALAGCGAAHAGHHGIAVGVSFGGYGVPAAVGIPAGYGYGLGAGSACGCSAQQIPVAPVVPVVPPVGLVDPGYGAAYGAPQSYATYGGTYGAGSCGGGVSAAYAAPLALQQPYGASYGVGYGVGSCGAGVGLPAGYGSAYGGYGAGVPLAATQGYSYGASFQGGLPFGIASYRAQLAALQRQQFFNAQAGIPYPGFRGGVGFQFQAGHHHHR